LIASLNHYAIGTQNLKASLRFYTEVLGLKRGYRPPFPFEGHWLYLNEQDPPQYAVVHLIGLKHYAPTNPSLEHQPLAGTGPLDHIAFLASDWPQFRTRLQTHAVAFVEGTVPALGFHQVFLVDPSGISIELNFPALEAAEPQGALNSPH
jgi:catechol 2,3-dioxygenase-like lactoylglutathione lyase family enzyme